MDKNQAVTTFLKTYADINNNPLFFNFGDIENNAYQVNVSYNDTSLNKQYVDGSELRRYTIYIDSFKSVSTTPVVTGMLAENIDDMQEVQKLLDWILIQADNKNYPDFGINCTIDSMTTKSTEPELLGIDSNLNPPIAIYRITVDIDYIDSNKCLWSNNSVISI